MRPALLVLLWLFLGLPNAMAIETEKVRFTSQARNGATIYGHLLRPEGAGPFPAVIALHGCGGLWRKNGSLTARHADWAERLRNAGYVVLFPDSFRSRGQDSLCKVKPRPVKHSHRIADLRAAADWLATQPFVNASRIAVLAWSNGGSTLLRAMAPNKAPTKTDFVAAIAFYPSCRWALEKTSWRPRLKPLILMGAADDWTPPEPCRALARRWGAPLLLYAGAYHGFDAPDSPVRVLTGRAFSARGDGVVHVGTHPQARAAAIAAVLAHLKTAFGKKK